MRVVDVSRFPCVSERKHRDQITRIADSQTDLMPHQVAAVTGCSMKEAMGFLLFLAIQDVADPKLLVYHSMSEHSEIPVASLPLKDGLPSVPFYCEQCEKQIEDSSELMYDLLFVLRNRFELVVCSNGE